MDAEWKIARSQRVCAACATDIPKDVDFFSCLRDDPDEGMTRLDFCEACWSEKRPYDAFSFWKTHIPSAPPSERSLIDLNLILDFFVGMNGATDPSRQRLLFVTALYLVRRRVLRLLRTERRDGEAFLLVRCPRLDREFLVPDIDLPSDELEQLNDQLSMVLQKVVSEEEDATPAGGDAPKDG